MTEPLHVLTRPLEIPPAACRCPEGDDCWHWPSYVWCRACEEHHRQECVVNELGQGLDPEGNPWPDQA